MKVEAILKVMAEEMAKSGSTTAKLEAQILLEQISGKNRSWLLAHPEFELDQKQQETCRRLVKKRVQGWPIAYLAEVKEFYGLEFKVTPDVLIPRPETEALAEYAITHAPPNDRLLDLGTGSGCIAVAIAKHRPDLEVKATDISNSALKIAQFNAKQHQVKIEFYCGDLLQIPPLRNCRFDLITANLPYLRDNATLSPEGQIEPAEALRGGSDGLDLYRRCFAEIKPYLTDKAQIIIEADPWQHPELITCIQQHGFTVQAESKFMIAFTS